MQRTKADSTRTFLHWSAPIMVGHFIIAVWHLFLVVKVQPGFPDLHFRY
jgi:hypothetical protein